MANTQAFMNKTNCCYFGRPQKFNNIRDADGRLVVSQEACPGQAPGGRSVVFGPGDEYLDIHGVFGLLSNSGNQHQVFCYGPTAQVDEDLRKLGIPQTALVSQPWASISHGPIKLDNPIKVKGPDGEEHEVSEIPASKGVVFTGVHRIISDVSKKYEGVDMTAANRIASVKTLKDQEQQILVKDKEVEILKRKLAEAEEKLSKETSMNRKAEVSSSKR